MKRQRVSTAEGCRRRLETAMHSGGKCSRTDVSGSSSERTVPVPAGTERISAGTCGSLHSRETAACDIPLIGCRVLVLMTTMRSGRCPDFSASSPSVVPQTFAVDKKMCPSVKNVESSEETQNSLITGSLIKTSTFSKLSKPQIYDHKREELQFPQELRESYIPQPLCIKGDYVTWYRPIDLNSLLVLKHHFPNAKIVVGNTEVGIETKFKRCEYPIMITTTGIEELRRCKVIENKGISIGGAVTLSQLEHFLEEVIAKRDNTEIRGYVAMLNMIHWFASHQIRNVASLAGNLATASPISDMNPILMALGSTLLITKSLGKENDIAQRTVKVSEFFKGYRKVDMSGNEIIQEILVPFTRRFEFVECYKQARRRDDDIAIVNACFRMLLSPQDDHWVIKEAHSGFGGMAPTTIRAPKMEKILFGSTWGSDVMEKAYDVLSRDLYLPHDVPGGMAAYRQTLAISFLFKFYVGTCDILSTVEEGPPVIAIDEREKSAKLTFLTQAHPISHGYQEYEIPKGGLQHSSVVNGKDHSSADATLGRNREPVGLPLVHRSAMLQCTGEANYTDDIISPSGTLHAAFVLSTRPHARILSIDSSVAETAKGFIAFLSAKDLTEKENKIGPIILDEQLFRSKVVTSTGQPLGLVVAKTSEDAERIALLVKVQYEDLPAVLTIKEAISAQSFHRVPHIIQDGDIDAGFESSDVIIEGEMKVGGQEHFYLECNAALVIPGEDDEITIMTSTQNTMKTQKFAAHVCGVHASKVVCKVKRMGGGFGGKETRTVFISSAVALAAYRLRKPVRINIDRDEDMWITGTRHPFFGRYRLGAKRNGKIMALKLDVYANAGFSLDLSEPVTDRALFHCDNSYKIPNIYSTGYTCMTNTGSNTAFRGFGGPQGMLICETYIEHLANTLKIPSHKIRELNMYEEGQRTHFGQLMVRNPLHRMWKELRANSNFNNRLIAVSEFNNKNRWRKRGISMLPTKFGINFTAKFMNQAGALVHIYTDGTVLVSHGGTEMGQGLHTKMIQIAAKALNIPCDNVFISNTATDKVANSSPTAASASSDLYGMAILNACEQLNERLKPFRKKMVGKNFKEIVLKAFFERVDLSAHGFYKVLECGYNWEEKKVKCNSERGTPFNYFTFGCACSEVEIDVLSGDMRILRSDILMDVGNSLNPAIDIGQIEGAFIQGVGWCMIEETVWGCNEFKWLAPGSCFTRGPGSYKIPSFNDVPIDFRVHLLKDHANPKAIHSSRGIGEPPLFLGASVFLATRSAIKSARCDVGLEDYFVVNSPLTPERIRMACCDKFTKNNCDDHYQPSGFY